MRGRGRRALRAWLGGHRKFGFLLGGIAAALACAAPAQAQSVFAAPVGFILPPVAAQLPDEPAVFGTVPVAVKVKPIGSRWSRVMRAPLDQPALVALTDSAWGIDRKSVV